MKLVVAIVHNHEVHNLVKEFVNKKIPHTKLTSVGGFLKQGNTTFLIGVEEEKVEGVLTCIKETCQTHEEIHQSPSMLVAGSAFPFPVVVGGATVFVIDAEQFYKF